MTTFYNFILDAAVITFCFKQSSIRGNKKIKLEETCIDLTFPLEFVKTD